MAAPWRRQPEPGRTKRILTVRPPRGGLNNQRLAFLGLVVRAGQEGAAIALPDNLVDFSPDETRAAHPRIPFGAVFDQSGAESFIQAHGLCAEGAEAETLDYVECRRIGNRTCVSSDPSGLGAAFFRACGPASSLARQAQAILGLLGEPRPVALQLRIERDWQRHLATRGYDVPNTPEAIFAKVAATPGFEESRIYAACNEEALTEPREHIRSVAERFGISLIFQSDLEVALPASELQRSMIQFAVCLGASRYIGLQHSTFSNACYFAKSLQEGPFQHYVFDKPGDQLRLR